jgi:Mg2+ and Co2+ transporter CorA
MKKLISVFMGILCLLLLSCSNILEEEKIDNTEYGSIIVRSGNLSDRALDIDLIKYANVKITGNGITPNNEPYCEPEVEGGVGYFKIEKVPVGKNRIVTVQALDSSKAVISNVRMRAVVDVETNKESEVTVTWNTTAVGDVFAKLYADGVDLASVDRTAIENTIYYEGDDSNKQFISPFLIDTDAIANDYKTVLKEPINYVLQPASLKFTVNEGLGTYKIQVCDQLSKVYTGSSTSGTVENIAPGTYQVK